MYYNKLIIIFKNFTLKFSHFLLTLSLILSFLVNWNGVIIFFKRVNDRIIDNLNISQVLYYSSRTPFFPHGLISAFEFTNKTFLIRFHFCLNFCRIVDNFLGIRYDGFFDILLFRKRSIRDDLML